MGIFPMCEQIKCMAEIGSRNNVHKYRPGNLLAFHSNRTTLIHADFVIIYLEEREINYNTQMNIVRTFETRERIVIYFYVGRHSINVSPNMKQDIFTVTRAFAILPGLTIV